MRIRGDKSKQLCYDGINTNLSVVQVLDRDNHYSYTMENEPMLTEEQIRMMRGDLQPTRPAAGNEPSLNIPTAPQAPTSNGPIFDADEPSFSPNTTNQMPSPVDELIAHEGGKGKLWWIVGGVVAVIILGFVGYFVLYGLINSTPTVTPTNTETTEIPTIPQTLVEPMQPTAPVNTSAFINEPDAQTEAVLQNPLTRADVVKTLTNQGAIVDNGITEIKLTSSNGSPSFAAYFTVLVSDFTAHAKTSSLFADQFTTAMYRDAKGSWPAYVISLKTGFSADDLRAWFMALEKATPASFFLATPGKMAPYKDGVVNGKYADRYAAGTTAGASLGYLMLPQQNKVIISTSFDGMKEVLRLMGL